MDTIKNQIFHIIVYHCFVINYLLKSGILMYLCPICIYYIVVFNGIFQNSTNIYYNLIKISSTVYIFIILYTLSTY